ncbi:MAG TPA: hypothetical protein VNU49_00685 [Opitutaceae bacterium]|jgi:hypothetical protein|nr:hypothetical protein [Opitutaceae bacterium]
MKSKELLTVALAQIAKATKTADFVRISELTKIASRIQGIDATITNLVNELKSLETKLTSKDQSLEPTPVVEAVPYLMGPLAIEINWSIAGHPFGKMTLCEPIASDTLCLFVEEIARVLGEDVLPKLAGVKANRGPFLSTNPFKDFAYGKNGQTYSSQRVGSTQYFVLTHSSTIEKIEIVKSISRELAFPSGAVRAFEVSGDERASAMARRYI